VIIINIRIGVLLKLVGTPLFAGLLFAPLAIGTPEMAKKEKKRCVYCHTAIGKPELNEAGEYYKKHGTLEGYEDQKKDEKKKKPPVDLTRLMFLTDHE